MKAALRTSIPDRNTPGLPIARSFNEMTIGMGNLHSYLHREIAVPTDPRRPSDLPAQETLTVPFAGGSVSRIPASRIKVFLAHDDPLLAAGLEATLSQSNEFELLVPASQQHSIQLRQSVSYADVTVADYGTALKMLDVFGRQLRVMVVTPESRETSVRLALDRGVRGYLTLGCGMAELRDALRTVSRGDTALGPLAATRVAESLRSRRLTSREAEVLRILMVGYGNKGIANLLAVSEGTVKTHVKSILSKLEAGSRTEAASIAQRRGIVSDAELSGSRRGFSASIQRARGRDDERKRVAGTQEPLARSQPSQSALPSRH